MSTQVYQAPPAPSVWEKLTGPSTELDLEIIRALSGKQGLLLREVAQATGRTVNQANSRLQVLRRRQLIGRTPGHPGKYYLL